MRKVLLIAVMIMISVTMLCGCSVNKATVPSESADMNELVIGTMRELVDYTSKTIYDGN